MVNPGFVERAFEPRPALDEFGRSGADGAEERNLGAAASDQMLAGEIAAFFIIRANRRSNLAVARCAPPHEMRPLADELLEPRARGDVIAVAEQQDAIGLAAVLIINVPVARRLLERDQQVVAGARAAAGQRSQHRQVEGVDQRVVGGRILEEQ